jgi:hypothetical protein
MSENSEKFYETLKGFNENQPKNMSSITHYTEKDLELLAKDEENREIARIKANTEKYKKIIKEKRRTRLTKQRIIEGNLITSLITGGVIGVHYLHQHLSNPEPTPTTIETSIPYVDYDQILEQYNYCEKEITNLNQEYSDLVKLLDAFLNTYSFQFYGTITDQSKPTLTGNYADDKAVVNEHVEEYFKDRTEIMDKLNNLLKKIGYYYQGYQEGKILNEDEVYNMSSEVKDWLSSLGNQDMNKYQLIFEEEPGRKLN